ncbi:MAG TPA: flagellar hook-length control protein FliK [Acidobacteriota bacterium]|nr:flagellar hook-length control protein FliK [Acidobacteriota bacterium]
MQPIQFISPESLFAGEAQGSVPLGDGQVSADFIQELIARLVEGQEEGLAAEQIHVQEDSAQEEVQFLKGSADSASRQQDIDAEDLFYTGVVVEGEPPVVTPGTRVPQGSETRQTLFIGQSGQDVQSEVEKAAPRTAPSRPIVEIEPHIDAAAAKALRTRLAAPPSTLDLDQVIDEAVARSGRQSRATEGLPEDLRGVDVRRLVGASVAADQVLRSSKEEGAGQGSWPGGSSSASSSGASQSQSAPALDSRQQSQGDRDGSQEQPYRDPSRASNQSARAGQPQAQTNAQASSPSIAARSGAEGSFSDALTAAGAEPRASTAAQTRPAAAAEAPYQNIRGADQDQVFNQIVRSARLFQSEGGQNFEIRLKPEFLGRIQIDTRLGADNTLTTRFLVEDPEVRALLEHRLPALADRLSEGGVRIQSVEVQNMNSGDAGRSQADAQQGQQRPGEGGKAQQQHSADSRRNSDSSQQESNNRPRSHQGLISLVA